MWPLITRATSAQTYCSDLDFYHSLHLIYIFVCIELRYFYPRPASLSGDHALLLNATHHINLQPAKILVYISYKILWKYISLWHRFPVHQFIFRFSHLRMSIKQKSGATENQENIIFNSGVNIFYGYFYFSIRT